MRETRVRSLGREDPLEKAMATHSSILSRRIPWTNPWQATVPWGHKDSDRVRHNWATDAFTFTLGPRHSFAHPQPLTQTTTNLFSIPVCSIYLESTCKCCCWIASALSDSARPHRWQPTRLPCPWDSPGKNTGVVCHFLFQCRKVKSESEVAQSSDS